jgi:hypothetical protein
MLYRFIIIAYVILYVVLVLHDLFFVKENKTQPKAEEEEVDISEEAKEFTPVEVVKDPPVQKKNDEKESPADREEKAEEQVKSHAKDDSQPLVSSAGPAVNTETAHTKAQQSTSAPNEESRSATDGNVGNNEHTGCFKAEVILQAVHQYEATGKCRELTNVLFAGKDGMQDEERVSHPTYADSIEHITIYGPETGTAETEQPDDEAGPHPDTSGQPAASTKDNDFASTDTSFIKFPDDKTGGVVDVNELLSHPCSFTGAIKVEKIIESVHTLEASGRSDDLDDVTYEFIKRDAMGLL